MRRASAFLLAAIPAALLHLAPPANAQTWVDPRSTPSLRELVAVDASGEEDWPFGAEDVAGDGLGSFEPNEQAVDLRSAYASTDGTHLWLRAYVVAASEPDASLRVFAFIDSDDDDTTGGSAEATDLDPELAADPTAGGYDFVLGLSGDATVLGLWSWAAAQDTFVDDQAAAARAEAEVGVDRDPLRFAGDQRGYLQGKVELADIELAADCGGNLFLRALSDEGNDADVGLRGACLPADTDGDGVPNAVEAVNECTTSDDCLAGAVCVGGECRYTPACRHDADCSADEGCVDGLCVVDGGQSCDTAADCDGLVCSAGSCEPCTSASCAAGQTCAADGRCVDGSASGGGGAGALVDADEEVQGGACTCGLARRQPPLAWLGLAALTALLFVRRRQG
jgi:hypothetical protein